MGAGYSRALGAGSGEGCAGAEPHQSVVAAVSRQRARRRRTAVAPPPVVTADFGRPRSGPAEAGPHDGADALTRARSPCRTCRPPSTRTVSPVMWGCEALDVVPRLTPGDGHQGVLPSVSGEAWKIRPGYNTGRMPARTTVVATLFRSVEAHERADRDYWRSRAPAERLAMMWQLALDAWAFAGDRGAQSRLPRHVVRVHRAGR